MIDSLTISRSDLGRLEPLAKGGTAAVFGLPDLRPADLGVMTADGLAYKEYKQKIRSYAGPALTAGLRSLVAFRQRKLAEALRQRWDERIIWPVRMVTDDHGDATGIVMPLIPYRFFQRVTQRSGPPKLVTREVEKLFGDDQVMRRIGMAPVSQETRLRIVGRIAATYAMMHRKDIVIGDISGRNLVYDPASGQLGVLALDADSARVEGSRSAFSTQPHTPQWEPPEALAAVRQFHADGGSAHPDAVTAQSKRTDVYKFGLLVVRILDHGRGRSVNRDPARALGKIRAALGDTGAQLLLESLESNPATRPTMRDWYDVFYPGREGRRSSFGDPTSAPAVTSAAAQSGSTAILVGGSTDGPYDGQMIGGWVFIAGEGWKRQHD